MRLLKSAKSSAHSTEAHPARQSPPPSSTTGGASHHVDRPFYLDGSHWMCQLPGPSCFPGNGQRTRSPGEPFAAAAVFREMGPGLSGSAAVGLRGASPPIAATRRLTGRVRTTGETKGASAQSGRESGPEALIGQERAKNGRGATSNQERHLQSGPHAEGFVGGCSRIYVSASCTRSPMQYLPLQQSHGQACQDLLRSYFTYSPRSMYTILRS